MVADGPVPMWYQDICNNHYEMGSSTHPIVVTQWLVSGHYFDHRKSVTSFILNEWSFDRMKFHEWPGITPPFLEMGFQGLVIQIKICAEYRDMLPRPRLVCQEPGLRPIGRSPGVPDKSSRGLGSMSRYSAQILICFIAYIFPFFCLFLCGFGWELCRTATMHSALCHCPL